MSHVTIGLDLGTSCGWSVLAWDGERISSGVWDLSGNRFEGGGMRYVRFERHLVELFDGYPDAHVSYEEVRRHAGTTAAHVYGGLLATLQRVCELREVPYVGVPVGTIKKLATGKGNASKAAMCDAAMKKWPGSWPIEEDDEADALWVAEVHRLGHS